MATLPAGNEMYSGLISLRNGQLILETSIPVAAFDIVIDGVTTTQLSTLTASLSDMGMTCQLRQHEGMVRVIGYSLAGITLPVGQTELCRLEQSAAKVVYAKLSDICANEIAVGFEKHDATGISEMTIGGNGVNDNLYNLTGQRVSKGQLKSGLYIVNGKKITYKKK
jgi:hypothetical protein